MQVATIFNVYGTVCDTFSRVNICIHLYMVHAYNRGFPAMEACYFVNSVCDSIHTHINMQMRININRFYDLHIYMVQA